MTSRTDMPSHDALVLIHVLEKLRARGGLTHLRLDMSRRIVAAPLLNLDAVRRYATVHDMELSLAALDVIKECVRQNLHDSQRIVADTVLGLGIFQDAYSRHGIETRIVSGLYSDLLGRRRSTLLSSWRQLHEALRVPTVEPPSDRALRGTVEPAVLRELAQQLLRREVDSFGSRSAPSVSEKSHCEKETSTRRKILVIGGAVMDATFRTQVLPATGTSAEANAFELAPGGKGLWQAVAAARLGLDVALVAAVADDHFGHEIANHLQAERVDTSLLKLVREARTPITGVVEFELGDSFALTWRNWREIHLDVPDVDRLGPQIASCEAVLMTFEIPRETLQHTLALLGRLDEPKPIVIVTPGQPYKTAISGQALSQIDYLVAHTWELGPYASPDRGDVDAAARRLLAHGVDTLCVPNKEGCTVYSKSLGAFTAPTVRSAYEESSVARDAFCAALAAKLIDKERLFSEEVVQWATAAMAATIADYPLTNPMPDRRRVDQLLERLQ